jgi:hypothetical protein
MSESPPEPRSVPIWPPPPETAEVKKEQIFCTAINAVAITLFVAGLVGPIITMMPDEELSGWTRFFLGCGGILLHLAARTYLRYMTR